MSGTGKGRTVAEVAADRKAQLNAGKVEARTLTECLAVDFSALMRAALPGLGAEAIQAMERAGTAGITRRMALAAELIGKELGAHIGAELARHPSDTVRGWACFLIGAEEGLSMEARLAAIRPLADDKHFGVREWAWLALRPHLAAELERAISLLSGWTGDESERIRRFASEAIRPRGVWCRHLKALQQDPSPALAVLSPLRSDRSAYVRDSVGNWLNDASKDNPDWVRALCQSWAVESPTPETTAIIRRALRTIGPQ